jgi:hypothetical protein
MILALIGVRGPRHRVLLPGLVLEMRDANLIGGTVLRRDDETGRRLMMVSEGRRGHSGHLPPKVKMEQKYRSQSLGCGCVSRIEVAGSRPSCFRLSR